MIMKLNAIKTYNWLHAIRGMRNPLQSYHDFDSNVKMEEYDFYETIDYREVPIIGAKDFKLMTILAKLGGCHPKYLRQIGISCNVTAPLYWWVEYDTYKVGTVANSTSKMFKLGSRQLTKEDLDFDTWDEDDEKQLEIVNKRILAYIESRDRDKENGSERSEETEAKWRKLQQCVPSNFIYTRTVTLNYEVLRSMYFYRHVHKLKEWREFCNLIVENIPYGQHFIVDCNKGKINEDNE